MCTFGWPITLLLFRLLGSAISSPAPTFSPTSPLLHLSSPSSSPNIISSLSSPSLSTPPPTPPLIDTPAGSLKEDCSLIVSPSALVVRFGDPVTANCSVTGFSSLGWEVEQGAPNLTMDSFLVWTVDSVTVWSLNPMCYALSDHAGHCFTRLNVTIYKPPDNVSISYRNHSGPMIEGDQYTLQCTVRDVAPVGNLTVTFYRGQEALGSPQSSNKIEMVPVTEIFTLNISPRGEDDGEDYWCKAELELGPEGPQLPPVVKSENLRASVHYGPQFLCPTKLKVKEGEKVTCEVKGNPIPLVTWLRNGKEVATPLHSSKKHAGKYTVWAKGWLGQKNFTLDVEVVSSNRASNTGTRSFLMAVLLNLLIYLL